MANNVGERLYYQKGKDWSNPTWFGGSRDFLRPALETGGILPGDEVTITLGVQFVKA
jgi:hypothetical protein